MQHRDVTIDPAEISNPSNRRFRRILIATFSIIAVGLVIATVYVVFESRSARRFDPGMTTVAAEIVRDKAIEADDAETWIAIHDEILWPRHIESLHTSWTSIPGLIWKHRSITKAMNVLDENRFIFETEKVEFYGRALGMTDREYKPRITQACIDKMSQILKETYHDVQTIPHLISQSLNTRLSVFVERQARLGDATDQAWLAFLDSFSPEVFARWLRLQSSGSYFLQEASIRKSLENRYDKHPDDPWLVRLAGVIRSRDGKFAEAEPLLAKSAELFADDPEGRHAWGEARLALNMPVEAESIMGPPCRDSIHFETQEAMRLTFRAQIHEKQGQLEAARRDAEAAVKLNPRSVEGWETLAGIAKKSGDTDRSQFAETEARNWSDKNNRLKTVLKSFAMRIEETRMKDRRMRDDGGTVEPLVEALQQLEWPHAAEALKSARKIAAGEIGYPVFRKLPELQPGFPDRFFLPRPVLRSETPESRGRGGVRL
ncbi:hypothetical protein GC170_13880 [bacterium]|nr:hypothetical protein [bacterium]